MPDHTTAPASTILPRVRLWEWHDLPNCPYVITYLTTRVLELNYEFDFFSIPPLKLLFASSKNPRRDTMRTTDDIGQLLAETIDQCTASSASSSSAVRIIDLCSGAGGPAPSAVKYVFKQEMAKSSSALSELHLVLSDIVPHIDYWSDKVLTARNFSIDFCEKSVDATKTTNLHRELFAKEKNKEATTTTTTTTTNICTLFASFHHFDDHTAQRILASAVDNNDCDGILIVELSERRLLSTCFLALLMTALALVAPMWALPVPFWRRPGLFLQVLLVMPVLWLSLCWDTVVSCLRTMTSEELLHLAHSGGGAVDPLGKFEWYAAVRPLVPGLGLAPCCVYLRGVRRKETQAQTTMTKTKTKTKTK